MDLEELIENLTEHLRLEDYADNSINTILSQVSQFLRLIEGRGISPGDINGGNLEEFLSHDVASISTLKVRYFSLTALFNYWVLSGVVQKNPLQQVDIDGLRESVREISDEPKFTDADADILIEHAKNQYSAFRFPDYIIVAVLLSGLKGTEIARVEWDDFDMVRMKISVRAPDKQVSRVVPLSSYVEREHLLRSLLLVDESVELVLPRHVSRISSRANQIISDAGIDCTAKDIRAWYIRSLFYRGLSIQEVSKQCGASEAYLRRYVRKKVS